MVHINQSIIDINFFDSIIRRKPHGIFPRGFFISSKFTWNKKRESKTRLSFLYNYNYCSGLARLL